MLHNYTPGLRVTPGASRDAIEGVQARLRFRLPAEYRDFLLESNGAEGFVGEHYLDLWSIDKLEENNRGYHVEEFAPGLFLIGSDGGGTGYAFDTRYDLPPIVEIPLIGMGVDEATPCSSSFTGFLEYLYAKDT